MDGIALKILHEEMLDDSRMVADAFQKATARLERGDEIGYESCAHQLSRLYNVCLNKRDCAWPRRLKTTLTTNGAGVPC